MAALEDKIVQRAIVEVLNAIYEEDFLGFTKLRIPAGAGERTTRSDALSAASFTPGR